MTRLDGGADLHVHPVFARPVRSRACAAEAPLSDSTEDRTSTCSRRHLRWSCAIEPESTMNPRLGSSVHPPGRHYEVCGHRLWVEQEGEAEPLLPSIGVPTLILAGRYDRALYPALQRQFAQFMPQARFRMLERSGSFGHIEEPEAVFATVRELWATAR